MSTQKLSETEIETLLAQLPDWTLEGGKLHREYRFADFQQAMRFMNTAVPAIEQMNHHPEWLNVYNRVRVDLITHDAGGLTTLDFELAMLLEGIAKRLQ